MIAIIYNGNAVLGYHLTPDLEEMAELGTTYDLLDKVPTIVLDTPLDHYVERTGEGKYRLMALPPVPPDRIEQLETENLELKLALAELAKAQQTDRSTLSSHLRSWLKS